MVVVAVTAELPVPLVAVITAVCPAVAALAEVTKPVLAPTLATAVLLLLQTTEFVIVCVELSEYVPVATSCDTEYRATLGFAGVTAIDLSDGAGLLLPVLQAASNNVDTIAANTTCMILLRASNIAFLSFLVRISRTVAETNNKLNF